MPLAFSPYDMKLIAVAALAGWMLLVWVGRPLVCGFFFGLGWFGIGAWWLVETFHRYGPLPVPLSVLAVACLGMGMAVFPAFWAWLAKALAGGKRSAFFWAFILAGLAEEWMRGHLFTGLPWTPLGALVLDTPAVGWLAWLGVYGTAVFPLALAVIPMGLFLARKVVLMLLVALGTCLLISPDPYPATGTVLKAALVQANIPQDIKWDADFVSETIRRYTTLSERFAAGMDVIVWPEAAVPFFLERAPQWRRELLTSMKAWGVPVLFGGVRMTEDARRAQNGIFLYQPESDRLDFTGKRHLVPFGEYVPSWLPFIHALAPNIGDFIPAKGDGILETGSIRYGSLVCYEAIFPEEARLRVRHGAQVLINVTNDAWYGKSPAPWQHLQAARARAVEMGRYLLRAANTGITAVIAPDGKVVRALPWFTQGVLVGEFRLSDAQTPYLSWGDRGLFVMIASLLLIVGGIRWRE